MPQYVSQALLKKFYSDEETYEAVKEFLFAHLDQLGLSYVYDKQPTVGVADAKIVLDNAFKQIEDMFGENDKKKKISNEAR